MKTSEIGILLLCCLAQTTGSLPFNSLVVSLADAARLKVCDKAAMNLALDLLNKKLVKNIKTAGITVNVEEGDVIIDAKFPDMNIDTGHSCSFTLKALRPHAKGVIKKSSKLTGRFSGSTSHLHIFAEALIEARLDINVNIRARTGFKFFGKKCHRLARKTLGIDLDTSGQVKLGARLGAKNIKFDLNNGKLRLIFTVDFKLYGSVVRWDVDDLNLSNCNIKLFGKWKILSYCSLAKKILKKKIKKYINKWTKVEAPKLIKRLEGKIKLKNGQQVVIDINLPKRRRKKRDITSDLISNCAATTTRPPTPTPRPIVKCVQRFIGKCIICQKADKVYACKKN